MCDTGPDPVEKQHLKGVTAYSVQLFFGEVFHTISLEPCAKIFLNLETMSGQEGVLSHRYIYIYVYETLNR